MSRFLDRRYQGLAPYTPGEQPRGEKLIKLNTNELPYPPSEGVVQAVQEAAGRLNLYSDPTNTAVCAALAEHLSVDITSVFAGNGSDECLALAFQGLCPGGVAYADLTYGFYPVYAQLYGLDIKVIPLREDLCLAPEDYYALGGRTAFIANPNAPTGQAIPVPAVEEILQRNPNSVVVIDEAYVDFGWQSCVPLTERYENLLVVGTFSKASGLAGARLGYAVACPALIEDLNRLKYSLNPYNVNSMTAAAGVAALRDIAYYRRCRSMVAATRDRTVQALRGLGFECADSWSNFVFCRHPRHEGKALFEALRAQGILVRRWNTPRIKDYLRVTIGTDAEMDAVLAALREIV